MTSLIDPAQAIAQLSAARVPEAVLEVTRRLQRAGHAAVLVGGAVRDVLLGLAASDWDLASSATPDEVMTMFPKTIPTGVEHGTVTVLVRDRGTRHPVEVTTFRGEGRYIDGRRPQSVRFLRELDDDLARRDFTINALAWDPVALRFSDPFGGLADLTNRLVRAVGCPLDRFREDGLRTMRAVRFCASRDLRLESDTQAAIGQALDVFAKVSRERVHAELVKMLASPRPSLGLRPMWRTGLWPYVFVSLPTDDAYESTFADVDAMTADPTLRLARVLRPLLAWDDGPARIEACVEALKPSRAERAMVLALTGLDAKRVTEAQTPHQIRRAASRLSREVLEPALEVWGLGPLERQRVRRATAGHPLSIRELALKGRDLIAQGVVSPGPEVGEQLAILLDAVLDDPSRNTPHGLLQYLRSTTTAS